MAQRQPRQWTLGRGTSGNLVVQGLRELGGGHEDTLLIHFYPAGDVDLVMSDGTHLHSALYDLFQTNDDLAEGDTFALDGKALYRCEGVHVVKLDEAATPHLSPSIPLI